MYSDGLFSFVLQFYEVVEYAAGIIVDSDFEWALGRSVAILIRKSELVAAMTAAAANPLHALICEFGDDAPASSLMVSLGTGWWPHFPDFGDMLPAASCPPSVSYFVVR